MFAVVKVLTKTRVKRRILSEISRITPIISARHYAWNAVLIVVVRAA